MQGQRENWNLTLFLSCWEGQKKEETEKNEGGNQKALEGEIVAWGSAMRKKNEEKRSK